MHGKFSTERFLFWVDISKYQFIDSFSIREDNPEHLMNPLTQCFFIQLMQLSVFPHMHFNMQLDLPHPAKIPKQLAQLVDSSVFFVIHFSVHSAAPQQPVPQLSKVSKTSFFLEFQISLSSWLHLLQLHPAPWILPVSPELSNTLFYREERYSWWGNIILKGS